jgi:hypothetical protein
MVHDPDQPHVDKGLTLGLPTRGEAELDCIARADRAA